MFQRLLKQENVKEYEIWGATSYSVKSAADGKPNVYIRRGRELLWKRL